MIKVFIADDHPVIRHGLMQILAGTRDRVVAGEAVNGLHVLESIRGKHWDVVVLDSSIQGSSGLDVLKDLKRFRSRSSSELAKAVRKVSIGGKDVSSYLAENWLMMW